MPVGFDRLLIGAEYERPYLARLWGYRGFQAISRGVVTPAGMNKIILFVTEEKQQSLTQYKDHLVGPYLHWEGEARHASDERIIDARNAGDEIHLFHRKVHHSPFIYLGIIDLLEHSLLPDDPSQFIFSTVTGDTVREISVEYDFDEAMSELLVTERNALVKSRLGQGVFRDGLFRLWGGCAVTGYERPAMLLASHIKPWKDANNRERLDPNNGLLLHPTIDRLFDRGFISFDNTGKLLRANNVPSAELVTLGVNPRATLRTVPDKMLEYLEYHRDCELGRNGESPERLL